jgi:hypothetical protein
MTPFSFGNLFNGTILNNTMRENVIVSDGKSTDAKLEHQYEKHDAEERHEFQLLHSLYRHEYAFVTATALTARPTSHLTFSAVSPSKLTELKFAVTVRLLQSI